MFNRLAKLERAYRRYPQVPLFARLADLYLRRGQLQQALDLCEEGCKRFPQYPAGYQILSKCYETQGRLEEARTTLDQALHLDPENPEGFRQLSTIYRQLGVPGLALKSLQQAASLDPLSEELATQIQTLTHPAKPAAPSPEEGGNGHQALAARTDGSRPGSSAEGDTGEEVSGGVARNQGLAGDTLGDLHLPPPSDDLAALLKDMDVFCTEAGEQEAKIPQRDRAVAAAPAPVQAEADTGEPGIPPPDAAGTPQPGSGHRPDSPAGSRKSAFSVSGRVPWDEQALIRVFQEIENQRPQGMVADSLSPAVNPVISSLELEEHDIRIATVTLAEIYASQGLNQQAAEIYREILAQDAENEAIKRKLADLEQHL